MSTNRGFSVLTRLALVLVVASTFCSQFEQVDALLGTLSEKVVRPTRKLDVKCLNRMMNETASLKERCEFFKCFEERYPCGSDYWIMNWGFKYCQRYADESFRAKFTPSGIQLLDHINECLPNRLARFYKTRRSMKCKRLSHKAFRAQGQCYAQAQELFCKAFPENTDLFINVLDPADFMNFDSIRMIRETANKCSPPIDLFSLVMG